MRKRKIVGVLSSVAISAKRGPQDAASATIVGDDETGGRILAVPVPDEVAPGGVAVTLRVEHHRGIRRPGSGRTGPFERHRTGAFAHELYARSTLDEEGAVD